MSTALVVFLTVLLGGAIHAREFDLRRDTFAFANETVFQYGVDERGELHVSKREKPPKYAHRCFVLARAVLQFWQFAQFAPDQPKVSREEYARLIRRVSRVPVWSHGPRPRIVIPGYRDLQAFSKAMPSVLQENLGAWFPTYVRVGNYRMAMGHPRSGQASAARWLIESMNSGRPRAVYLAKFPHMNHCVVPYRMEPAKRGDASGRIRFWVYDPNYPSERAWLDYVPAERSFEFQPRWYFPGGRVNLMRVYISPFH